MRTPNTRYQFDIIESVVGDETVRLGVNIKRLKRNELERLNANWDPDQNQDLLTKYYNNFV